MYTYAACTRVWIKRICERILARVYVCVCAGEEEEVGTVGRNIGGGSHDAIALASCSRSPPPSFFQASPLVTRVCRPLRRDERGIR